MIGRGRVGTKRRAEKYQTIVIIGNCGGPSRASIEESQSERSTQKKAKATIVRDC